jgi:hypothetical protein
MIRSRVATVLPRLRLLCVAVLIMWCTGGAGVSTELSIPPPPPDPQSLLNSLMPRLPPSWRLGQPSFYLGVPIVRIVIFDQWRGNPVSAAIALCPDTEDPIWQQTRVIRLIMRHRQRDWPPYDCRP